MIELDFREPETFKTPDGEEWIITPLEVEDTPLIFKFQKLYTHLLKIKEKKDHESVNELIFGNEKSKKESLISFSDILIDKSIKNEKNEKLPLKYRKRKHMIMLGGLIVKETMGVTQSDLNNGGDIPLELQKKSSSKSRPTSTPSKKKQGGKKKSS
jgi:hypothetical protein